MCIQFGAFVYVLTWIGCLTTAIIFTILHSSTFHCDHKVEVVVTNTTVSDPWGRCEIAFEPFVDTRGTTHSDATAKARLSTCDYLARGHLVKACYMGEHPEHLKVLYDLEMRYDDDDVYRSVNRQQAYLITMCVSWAYFVLPFIVLPIGGCILCCRDQDDPVE